MQCKLKTEDGTNLNPEVWITKDPYPIGSIYLSISSVNPSTLFGGQWRQIKDTFLFAGGTNYKVGKMGGESEVSLTIDEMPEHNHTIEDSAAYATSSAGAHSHYITMGYCTSNFASGSRYILHRSKGSNWTTTSNNPGNHAHSLTQHQHTIETTQLGESHNNMPPYLVVYMWERTA